MKHVRLFLLLFLFTAAILCLASCDFNALFPPGTTTAPTATTTATATTTTAGNGDSTSSAPVTTIKSPSVTTTVAEFKSENPIRSVSLSEDGSKLILRYTGNNNTQNLLTEVKVREGYSAAKFISHDFDTDTRILTLVYQEMASLNRAELILGSEAGAPITLYIQEHTIEQNGRKVNKLAYCLDLEDGEWTDFADAGRSASVNGVPILTALLNHAEYGKEEEVTLGSGMIFTVKQETESTKTSNHHHPNATNGAYLRFRATEWQRNGYHFVTDARLHGSTNLNFNITTDYEVTADTSTEEVQGGNLFKGSSDDITPIHINGTYIGANHGYYVISAIPNTIGLTESDIGSVWAMGTRKFVLVKVQSETAAGGTELLWFCPYDTSSMASGNFRYASISQGSTLTYVETQEAIDNNYAGPATTSITASANDVQLQFFRSTNHVTQNAYLDGAKAVDLSKDGVYEAEFVDFHETYDVMYLPSVLQYLMENVGDNSNESHYSDAIKDAYVTMDITYRFHKNGACVIYNDYTFKKPVQATFMSGVQSCAFPSTQYVYLPGTTVASAPVLQNSIRIDWDVSHLVDAQKPNTSYFQMTDENGAKAMNTGYYFLYGDARSEVRMSYSLGTSAPFGWAHSTNKMYPHLFRDNSHPAPYEAGKNLSFITYRIPSVATDEDFIAKNWYWVGEEIMLSLHTQKELTNKEVALPDYMNGMTLTVVEGGSGTALAAETVSNGKITLSTDGADYVIIKLTPAE